LDGRKRIIALSLVAAFLLGISWAPLIVTSRGEGSQDPSGPRWDLLDQPWDSYTGWGLGGNGTSEISPAGQLHNVADVGKQVYRTRSLGRLPESGYMVVTRVKVDNFGTGDGWFGYRFYDGLHEVSIRIYRNRVECGEQNYSVTTDDNWHNWTFLIYSTANTVQVYRDNTHLVTWTGSLPPSSTDGKVDASITRNPAGKSGAESHTDYLRMATISVIPVTPAILLADNFNDGNVSDWAVEGDDYWSINLTLCMSLPFGLVGYTTNASEGYSALRRNLTATYAGDVSAEFWYMPLDTSAEHGGNQFRIRSEDGRESLSLRTVDGTLQYNDSGAWRDICSVSAGVWYHVEACLYGQSRKLDVYVNGTLMVEDGAFADPDAGDFRAVELGVQTGTVTSQYCVDDVIVGKIGYTVAFTALDWDEATGVGNLTIAMFSNDTLYTNSTVPTNGTGYAEAVGVEVGNYTVKAFYGSSCVGLNESVRVTGNQTVTLRCWMYDVNVECLNAYGEAASGIWVVMTLVDGGAGYLSSSGAGGVARFENLPNGTYVVRPLSGRTVTGVNLAPQSLNVTEDERNATLRCDVADLTVRVVTREGGPLVNATTRLIDSSTPPRLVGTQQTNATGHIQYKNLPVESYAFTVEWMHALFSITHDKLNLSLPENRTFSMECDVYNLTIACLDMWGRKAPGADVTISVLVGGAVRERHYTADPSGMVFEQLPGDSYEVRVTYGIYSGSAAVSLTESKAVEVRCGISLMASTYTAATVVAWVVLGAGWEWRRRGAFHQVMRLRGMMSKLESLYQKGEIEYSHYQKLKAEYEERLEGLRRRGLE